MLTGNEALCAGSDEDREWQKPEKWRFIEMSPRGGGSRPREFKTF